MENLKMMIVRGREPRLCSIEQYRSGFFASQMLMNRDAAIAWANTYRSAVQRHWADDWALFGSSIWSARRGSARRGHCRPVGIFEHILTRAFRSSRHKAQAPGYGAPDRPAPVLARVEPSWIARAGHSSESD